MCTFFTSGKSLRDLLYMASSVRLTESHKRTKGNTKDSLFFMELKLLMCLSKLAMTVLVLKLLLLYLMLTGTFEYKYNITVTHPFRYKIQLKLLC